MAKGDVTCPECGRREAPGGRCSKCGNTRKPVFATDAVEVVVDPSTTAVLIHPDGVNADGTLNVKPVKGRKGAPRLRAVLGSIKADGTFTATIKPPKAVSIAGDVVAPEGGYPTREAWMLAAVDVFRPWFDENDEALPPVRISMGWPGGRGSKKGVLGQCWAASAVADGIPAIFVTPSQKDPVEVLETILHECIHAAGHMHHRTPFQKVARKFGFTNGGKTKTTREQSPDLYARLDVIAASLGEFPHGAVRGGTLEGKDGPPVQSTRMLKVSCEADGYTVRATKKWLQIAVPQCPLCEDEMIVEWK